MKHGLWIRPVQIIVLILFVHGCEPAPQPQPTVPVEKPAPPPPPKPTVKVEQLETLKKNTVVVRYLHHEYDRGELYVVLKTSEDLLAYKSQIEFLLKRLEDSQQKMLINEDGQETTGSGNEDAAVLSEDAAPAP